MSSNSLSSTLIWLSTSGPKVLHHGPSPRSPSTSTAPMMGDSDSTASHSPNTDDGETASLTLTREESVGATDYGIGLHPEADASELDASLVSSEFHHNPKQTAIFYEFVTSPNQATIDADVHGGMTYRTQSTEEGGSTSEKRYTGGTVPFHDSAKGPTASSTKLLTETLHKEPQTPYTQQPSTVTKNNDKTTTTPADVATPTHNANSVGSLHSSSSVDAPSAELASTAPRWGAEPRPPPIATAAAAEVLPPAVIYSPLGFLESDGKGHYYYFQRLLDSVEEDTVTSPSPALFARQHEAADQSKRGEEHLDSMSHPVIRPHPMPPPARPVTCPVARHHHYSALNNKAATAHTLQQLHRPTPPIAEYMTPLSLIHDRRKRQMPSVPVLEHALPSSSVRTVDVRPPGVPTFLHSEMDVQVVPTVVASKRLLRRLRPAALSLITALNRLKAPTSRHAPPTLRGIKPMATNVSVLRSCVLQSSLRAQRSLLRHNSCGVTVGERAPGRPPSSERGKQRLVHSTRTAHPHAQHAVYATAARLGAMHGNRGSVGLQSAVGSNGLLTLGDTSSRPSRFESLSSLHTLVITNPNKPVTETLEPHCTRAPPSSAKRAMHPAPSAPQRKSSAGAQRMRRTSIPATAALTSAVVGSGKGAVHIEPQASEGENDMRVNLCDLTLEIGREYDLMAASFAEMLFTVQAAPSNERQPVIADVKKPFMTPSSTCIYVHPRSPPPLSPNASESCPTAGAVMLSVKDTTGAEATIAGTPLEVPLARTSPRVSHPNFKRYPSCTISVSPPSAATAPRLSCTSACNAATPVVTGTVPSPSKRFTKELKLGWTPTSLEPVAVVTPRPRDTSKPKQRPLIAVPVSAAIKPAAALLPSPRSRARQDSRESNTSTGEQTTLSAEAMSSSNAAKTPSTTDNLPDLPPLNCLQLALIPSDDASYLQTPRNDSSGEPSQASPEWRDVPVPILCRSLIARIAPDCARGDRVSSSVLTVHPHRR
ncbi:hypothetical protein ABL78_2075 [Leptomonas seymouri]|uniref:Uncharacterized protein n=1 Tax=Leptomonas seymouri TaxID=5684 RepID=A0A0N0P7H9_LEPSE|nr:hypothetical protein ABL78_2075 [Leptomonas seymouri]|eukprot:KPI88816.1 hypothetical protein ABL78_2075 [Leptomonas seymouri]